MRKNTLGKQDTVVKKENEDFTNVVNQPWDELKDVSRFQIIPKNKDTDVASLAAGIKDVSDKDDKAIAKVVDADEKKLAGKKPGRARKIQVVPLETVASVAAQSNPNIQETITKNEEVIAKQTASVTPQTTRAITSPISTEKASGLDSQNKVTEEMKTNVFLKFIAMGFAHLYVKKTNEILNPLKFLANNFNTVILALLNLGIPFLMTWYTTTKVSIISEQIVSAPSYLQIAYYGIFYIASIVIWISCQAGLSGIKAIFKDSLSKVAKVGKETR